MAAVSAQITAILKGHVAHESLKAVTEAISSLSEVTGVESNPPVGCKRITNIWRDKDGNLTYEFEE